MEYVCTLEDSNEYLLEGKAIVKDLVELYQVILEPDCQVLHFKEDFLGKYFTENEYKIFIQEASKINKYLKYKVDKDRSITIDNIINNLQNARAISDIIDVLTAHYNEAPTVIDELVRNYRKSKDDILATNNKLGTMRLQLIDMEEQIEASKTSEKNMSLLLQSTRATLDTITNKLKYSYNKTDINNKIDIKINKYRAILYIKEITQVRYVDTLVYYIQEVLKTIYSQGSRLIVIESPYATTKQYMYPNLDNYMNLTYSSVQSKDIYMAGFQYKLMLDILKNPSNSNYLIIFDKSGGIEPFITGQNVKYIYTMSDINLDMPPDQKLSRDDIISYNKDGLYIPYIKNFSEISMNDKINKYSSMNVLKYIIAKLNNKEM